MRLKKLYKPIEEDLKELEKRLEVILKQKENKIVAGFGRHILAAPGKHLRPALVFLSAKTVGGKSQKIYDLAAAVELLHTATLIHDDVIDKAYLRRKRPSINSKWGNNLAILYGDYLYSKAFELISKINNYALTKKLLTAANSICLGEIKQIKSAFGAETGKREYLNVIANKTASLFEVSCEGGAILSGANKKELTGLKQYGHNLGMLFQVMDDHLDIFAKSCEIGKTAKNDLKSGKTTLPIILMHKVGSRKKVAAELKETIDYFSNKAKKGVSFVRDPQLKDSFVGLVDLIVKNIN